MGGRRVGDPSTERIKKKPLKNNPYEDDEEEKEEEKHIVVQKENTCSVSKGDTRVEMHF